MEKWSIEDFLCCNCQNYLKNCNGNEEICKELVLVFLTKIFSGEGLDKFLKKPTEDQIDEPITSERVDNLFKIIKQKSIEEAREQAKRDEEFWNFYINTEN